ncbi:MAG: hypothetical protein KDK70_10210 [Myxococcales bacterium]|nr:hypothetical protein [Myxococcales bacterium]
MVHIAADLPQFLQRRELAAYEQRLARTGYAYGVDLRRAQWLSLSMVGDPLMRTVDRRWSRLVSGLDADCLRPASKAPPTALLEELARLIHLLRAPLPTLRLLRPEVASAWPAVTPLGTTKGAIHWLVLDLDRVAQMSAAERTFALAAGLAHLQCDHGAIFAAHLMAHRGGRVGMVKGLLRPWAKVAVFSADRAGLVAVRSLDAALQALERQAAEHAAWMPRWPDVALRRQALQDFDRSSLMARRRLLSAPDGSGWSMAPPGREEEIDSISRRIRAVLDRLRKVGEVLDGEAEGRSESEASSSQAASGDAPSEADEAAAEISASSAGASTPRGPKAAPPPPPEPEPERTSRLDEALGDAWSLARCDARLTRRLGLL